MAEARRLFAQAYPARKGELDDCADPVEMLGFAAGADAGAVMLLGRCKLGVCASCFDELTEQGAG